MNMSTITRQSDRKKKESATEKSIHRSSLQPEPLENGVITIEVRKKINKASQEPKLRVSTRTKHVKTAAVKDKQSLKKTVQGMAVRNSLSTRQAKAAVAAIKGPQLEQKLSSTKNTEAIRRRGRPLKDSALAVDGTKDQNKKQPAKTKNIIKIIDKDQQSNVGISRKKETFLRKRPEEKLTVSADNNSQSKQSNNEISEQVKTVETVGSGDTIFVHLKPDTPSQQVNEEDSQQTRDLSILSAKSKDQSDVSNASSSPIEQSPKQQQVLQNNHVSPVSRETFVGPVVKSHINQYEPYWKQLKKQKLETENLKNQVNHLQKILQENNNRSPFMTVIGQQGDPLGFHVSPFLQFQDLPERHLPIHHWTNSFAAVPHTYYYQHQAFVPGINHSGWVPRVQPPNLLFNGHIPLFHEQFNRHYYQ